MYGQQGHHKYHVAQGSAPVQLVNARRADDKELERIVRHRPVDEVLLLVTDHPRIWELVGRDDRALLVAGLAQRGCSPTGEERFDGVRLVVLSCRGASTAP